MITVATLGRRSTQLSATCATVLPVSQPSQAMKITAEIESLCGVYLQALSVGPPTLLNSAQMAEVIEKFKHYGRSARRDGVS